MSITRMKTLFKREILDILRDKKTLVMMILVPIILYPLLIVGMTVLMTSIMASQEEKTYLVAFENDVALATEVERIFAENEEDLTYKIEIVESSDCKAELEALELDAYVVSDANGNIQIYYLSAKDNSTTAMSVLRDALDIYEDELREQRVSEAGLDVETILNPVEVQNEDLSTTEESIGNIIGSMMPFLIITVILMGAIYPAIDVTAGEKERGTLETLLTLPVTNFEMIMSKFLAVSTIACASAVLNIFSMAGAMAFLVTSSFSAAAEDLNIAIDFQNFIPGILFTIVVMMFFALLVTAVCMCTCVFAKNFKEANNYITPVMLVFMFGSYAPMLPDLELTAQTAAIPIVNVALMVEGLFQFNYNYGLFAIVLFSNVAYSLLAIMVLGKIYNSEAVLFSEGLSGVKIFSKRSEMKEKQMPGIGDVVLLLCVVLLLIFYVGTYAQIKWGFGGVAVQQGIILIAPLFYAWYMKADAKKLFSVRKIKSLQLLGSVCIGIAAFLMALIVGELLMPIFPESAENLSGLDAILLEQPVYLLVLVMAIMPAIGEELLFRGFLMGTLKHKYKAWITIAVTTFVFAAYHMSLIKLFTIGVVGLGLTWVAYKTGSIFASMCVHFLNNFMSVLISVYPEQIQKVVPVLFKDHLNGADIAILLGTVLVSTAIGLFCLCYKNDSNKTK